MTAPTTRVAFVGTGNIAGPYAQSLATHPELELVGVFDVMQDKAKEFAAAHSVDSYTDLEALSAARPDIVVNLTSAPYHYSTTKALLGHGLTVFSEKPLAMTATEAAELVDLAHTAGVRLSCAPSLWLGAASLETARRVRAGEIGDVRLVTAEVNQGRIETWHPNPDTFYQVGPVFDAGVYPLTYLTAVLGPIVEVTATSVSMLPERTTLSGETLQLSTPDGWVVVARFGNGAVLRLTCTFFVDSATIPRAVEFHGVDGSLRLDDWLRADAGIHRAEYARKFTELVPGESTADIDWCLGLADLAASIQEDRRHLVTAEHAAHVVEVLEAVKASAEAGTRIAVTSTFVSPLEASQPSNTPAFADN
ncbi:Gfo/Idh/MocA family oxidoreductase [Paenarthrobacter sp. OM7]|uniref:Gfo/Idh/MocA family protein n=1 Tax=Paenarthrobacter sp. OM7 TaxID=3041264 RepID=UPI002468E3BE|nr:Gfo/Idh/MocA family oxidoreductase [Paenarthrobacter sp. OM7]WGM20279.1 Gfo/Idh/MocA family oxidoreductase [Paenarthrobacter sp. OM7]